MDDRRIFDAKVREELRHWPYTIHQIDDTLDTALIEGRGKQLLFQALNSQILTAFVGSGVSAAYGRMSWRDWQNAQVSEIRTLSDRFLEVSDATLKHKQYLVDWLKPKLADYDSRDATYRSIFLSLRWLEYRRQVVAQARREVQNLDATFTATASDSGKWPGGDGLPVMFEIAKKLHDLLLYHRSIYLDENEDTKSDKDGKRDLRMCFGSAVRTKDGAPIKQLEDLIENFFENNHPSGTHEINTQSAFKASFLKYRGEANREQAKIPFERLAKSLLVDETAHAESLLRTALTLGWEAGRHETADRTRIEDLLAELNPIKTTSLKRDIGGIRENPKHYRVLNSFRLKAVHRLVQSDSISGYPKVMRSLLQGLSQRWERYLDDSDQAPVEIDREFLTPTSRFLVPMIWQLMKDPFVEGIDPFELKKIPVDTDFQARRSLIANRFDPLVKLAGKLRINRYLTTNYDFEIERMYQDRGYRRFDASNDKAKDLSAEENTYHFRADGVGGVVRDLTFSSKRSADLLTFAAGGTGADANIFHLHGRATASDDIVITERDYMDMYLRDSPNREIVDEAILVAFAATPILFLGLGMEESDLLRPLRQFISDKDRVIGYRSIVLMSADKDFDSRAKISAGLYTRYGAHTIFFGSGEVPVYSALNRNECEPRFQSLDWLHRITTLIASLKESADKRAKCIVGHINSEASKMDLSNEDLMAVKKVLDEEGESLTLDDKRLEKLLSSGYLDDPSLEFLEKVKQPLITFGKLYEVLSDIGEDLVGENGKKSDKAFPYLLGFEQSLFAKEFGAEKQALNEISVEQIESLTIQDCFFTSRRREFLSDQSNHRNIRMDGATYTRFYTDLLTDLMKISLRPFEVSSLSEGLRCLRSVQSAYQGLNGAFLTGCLSASLDGLEQEWRSWWRSWQQMPPHREARFEKIIAGQRQDRTGISVDTSTSDLYSKRPPEFSRDEALRRERIPLPARLIRHRVETVITDLSHCRHRTAPIPDLSQKGPNAFEKEYRTNVRIFDSFIYDVAFRNAKLNRPKGRTVQTIAASRGQGKGIFFSVLTTRLGLSSYISAAHFSNPNAKKRSNPVFVSSIFINLSFSAEIGSVFDMFVRAMVDSVCTLETLTSGKYKIESGSASNEFEKVLRDIEKQSDITRKALLNMAFSGEKASFSTSEKSLTSKQLKALDHQKSVIDIAIHASSQITAEYFRNKPRLVAIRELMQRFKKSALAFEKSNVFNLPVRPRVLFCFNAVEMLFDEKKRPKNLEISLALKDLFSKPARSIPFDLIFIGSIDKMGGVFTDDKLLRRIFHVGKNVPEIERERSKVRQDRLGVKTPTRKKRAHKRCNYIHSAHQVDPTEFLVDNFPILALALFVNRVEVRSRLGDNLSELTLQVKHHYKILESEREHEWLGDQPPMVNQVYHRTREKLNDKIVETFLGVDIPNYLRVDYKFPTAEDYIITRDRSFLKNLYSVTEQQVASADKQDWNDLRSALRGNRYCLTILMAAAQYIILTNQKFEDGGSAANKFLRNTVSHLLNASVSQKEEIVLKTVMNVYSERSIIGHIDYDHELHLLLMRNIAVIGCPVSPNVVVRLPEIRDYFNKVSMVNQLSRRRMVARALAVLSERGLTFRLRPHPKLISLNRRLESAVEANIEINGDARLPDSHPLAKFQTIFEKWPAEFEYRYALHRQVQGYCFERLGHLTAPPVTANNFAPTLYASMPSRVIRLSHEGYNFLRRLLLGLSQYPDIRYEDAARDMPIFTDDDVVTRVQALRAAMSMVRTCLSIAAVSRFDDLTAATKFTRKRGHFETYKVRLRWILRKAWEVHNFPERPIDSEQLENQINALYIDEIVWLYNEVGVICLVQGALVDAIGHARQAIKINREIEGDHNNGPMHNMLSLNLAVMQIERGRLTSAERRLNEICANETDTKKRVYLLAKGYLALIAQLQGRLKEASNGFSSSIELLEKDNEVRALAVLIRYQAELVAYKNPSKARQLLKRARDYAESGGHEDVRHRIMITEVWLSQTKLPDPHDRILGDRNMLREVESYAHMMGLWSLLVETLHAQGVMLLAAGDTIGSGRLVTRAMAIARRNDMTLRLNSLMTNYAKILIARNRIGSAQRLLSTALSMAKRSGHSLEVVRIHEVMGVAESLTIDN